MERLPVLSLLLVFARYMRQVLPLPAWGDSAEVRAFARRVITVLTGVVAQTATALDDAAVKLFAQVVENDEAWALFYKLVHDLFTRTQDTLTVTAGDQLLVEECALKAGVDISTITLILQLIQQYGPMLLELVKKLRNKETDPQPAI